MHYLYERPREKLQRRGVQSLSLVELVQLIVGSGGSGVSGASLARQLAQILDSGDITYEKLVDIKGVGSAKACQLLASLELGNRLRL